jgi:hypothetical protein
VFVPLWIQGDYSVGHSHHAEVILQTLPMGVSHQLSAVNSAGTSTASDLCGRYNGPQLATTRQVSLKTAMFKAQHNLQERDSYKVFVLSLPDEE